MVFLSNRTRGQINNNVFMLEVCDCEWNIYERKLK